MSERKPPFEDPAAAHRWFAVEFNNKCWDLVDLAERTAEESDLMVHLAHSALSHWAQVGTPVNRLRGLQLLATAYLRRDSPRTALEYLSQADALAGSEGVTPFDRAGLAAIRAEAETTLGSPAASAAARKAREALEDCTDAEERSVLQKLYPGALPGDTMY